MEGSLRGHTGTCAPRIPLNSPVCIFCECEGWLWLEQGRVCARCMQACVTFAISVGSTYFKYRDSFDAASKLIEQVKSGC